MKVLIVGSGGREHAMAWKVAQAKQVTQVWVAPGNAGTQVDNKVKNIEIAVDAIEQLVTFALQENIELTIVGPEVPLCLGIVDQFQQAGLKCFGPSKGAAQLEGSKAFSKDFLARNNIPTAAYANFTERQKAKDYVKKMGTPIVIKADGLAAGKGVIIAQDESQAFAAIEDMLEGNKFGDAGHRVVIEEFLEGEEASFIVMVDGKNILPLATSQDHKARDDGDLGPNTGGMGAYSPAPLVTQEMHQKIMQQVIMPTVEAMAKEGNPYTGFLYAGIMVSPQGEPKVLEFNCRFGDPETQPIMCRLQTDLHQLCLRAIEGKLDQTCVDWDPRFAVGVVMAAGGYPESYNKGDEISGIEKASKNCQVFHAGTKIANQKIVTHGGRVLCVVALADRVSDAQKQAYQGVEAIHFKRAYFRRDIGYRAIALE